MRGHTDCVNRCKLCCQDQKIFTVSNDKTAKIWNIDTGAVLKTYNCHDMYITSGDVSPDNTRGHINVISSCCMDRNERWLCTASWDKTLQVWDISTGMFRSQGPVTLSKGHEGSVSCCNFTRDGTLLVSGSYDQTVTLWDMETCMHKLSLKGHSDWVTDCSFSEDQKWVISCSKDKTMRLWNIEDTDHIPFVLEQRRAIGLKMVNCEQCGKAFSIAQLEDARELSLCVFCRLAQPNRNVPALDDV
uniref:Uncharacterized protein n=1 Tax=Branchiostoma floridae TaxID=7739 RepID=C3XTS9_BRAFL|eukprot:XP_002612294.1 hypothetical protein BRAFLDRAFT_122527 [Branchiostoma floridae]